MATVKPSEILFKAVDLINERGWTAGKWHVRGCASKECAATAMLKVKGATDEKGFAEEPYDIAEGALLAEVGECEIWVWNDAQKDKRTVTRKMVKVAKQLAAAGK